MFSKRKKKKTLNKCLENIPNKFFLKWLTRRVTLEWLTRDTVTYTIDIDVKMLISYTDFYQQHKGEKTKEGSMNVLWSKTIN